MGQVQVTGEIPAPLDEVWKVVSDFEACISAQGLPVIVDGHGLGMKRSITIGTAQIVERLESVDEANHTTSYSIVEGPLPLTGYLGTIHLAPSGDAATSLIWTAVFEAVGISEADAEKMMQGAYRAGIKGITKHFGG